MASHKSFHQDEGGKKESMSPWDQDLTISQVQDLMKREKGFDKSIKAYKGHLRRWGIRKNLKKEEAVQLASGNTVSKFWPDKRSVEYLRRVTRHIGQRRESAMKSWKRSQKARNVSPIPAQLYTRDVIAAVEIALFYGDVFLQDMNCRARVSTTTAPHESSDPTKAYLVPPTSNMQHDETFFDLFNQGMNDITGACPPAAAFANLNAAFDHLKGLLLADHPIIFYRLAAIVFSCREYPASDITRQVCRLLAVHLLQLGHVIMGSGHPINHWWSTGIRLLDSGQWETVDCFLQNVQRLGSKYIAYVPGTVDLITYAPSNMRGLKDEVLRDKIKKMAMDESQVSEAQEARLCLAELLLGQGEAQGGLQVLREAQMLRHLDLDQSARKAFWFSELFSRAKDIDEALKMLKEAIRLAKAEDGVGMVAFSMALDETESSDPGESLLLKRRALEQGIRMFQTHTTYQRHKY
ncbi:hypothetical protein N0V93_008842 [Gnomoniopsis smithogilvyi]|uniref:Clr5 domain-containing protein n=1 Tax=Gnomoniopsis smithogilvyi TaxID=1191159 RepID=A0A9W8YME9_9PEZI|nr:hypothetical protein N0V93_008842 [Gnomoniopsis smithogilvyi]